MADLVKFLHTRIYPMALSLTFVGLWSYLLINTLKVVDKHILEISGKVFVAFVFFGFAMGTILVVRIVGRMYTWNRLHSVVCILAALLTLWFLYKMAQVFSKPWDHSSSPATIMSFPPELAPFLMYSSIAFVFGCLSISAGSALLANRIRSRD